MVGLSVFGWHYAIDTKHRRIASAEPAPAMPALYSPNGRYACFGRGNDLWLWDRRDRSERSMTSDGASERRYGQISEASLARCSGAQISFPAGRWSPDSHWFLTHRIDESELPELPMVEHVPQEGGRPRLHTYKYCLQGDAKPKLELLAVHPGSGRVINFEIGPTEIQFYSPFFSLMRSLWFETANRAWFIRFDRYSRRAELIRLELRTGEAEVVFAEEADTGHLELNTYFADRPNVWPLSESGEFIWYSERDGWGHLYLHDVITGKMKTQITRGKFVVRRILHVDAKARRIIFSAHGVHPGVDPAHRTICAANFDGSGFEILLAHEGDICLSPQSMDGPPQESPFRGLRPEGGISPDGAFAVAQYWSVDRGNSTELVELNSRGRVRGQVIAAVTPREKENLPRPFAAIAADGVTPLHGVMFCPSDLDKGLSCPLIVYIYPGPGVGQSPQSYLSVRATHCRALAELGFVSIMLDTRRMAFRERALHQVGYGGFLEPQLADHAAVVRQLCERYDFIDESRVGIFGSSAGGQATARAMFDYGDLFKVGVSVCGPHDSRQGSFWADRTIGPIELDREDWNVDVAHKLQGKLLLIHGELDARVHIFHMMSLAAALIRSNRDFDLLIVPNEAHDVLQISGYAQRRLWDYFVHHLLGEQPPKDFEVKMDARATERGIRRGLLEIL
jgi:dienelactone hydrolase